MGHVGEQSEGEVLRAHQGRPEAACARSARLGADDRHPRPVPLAGSVAVNARVRRWLLRATEPFVRLRPIATSTRSWPVIFSCTSTITNRLVFSVVAAVLLGVALAASYAPIPDLYSAGATPFCCALAARDNRERWPPDHGCRVRAESRIGVRIRAGRRLQARQLRSVARVLPEARGVDRVHAAGRCRPDVGRAADDLRPHLDAAESGERRSASRDCAPAGAPAGTRRGTRRRASRRRARRSFISTAGCTPPRSLAPSRRRCSRTTW